MREQPWGDLAASSRMGMMQGDPLLDRCCVYSLQHSPHQLLAQKLESDGGFSKTSVADPAPNPDPYVFPHLDPSIIKQKL